MLKRRCNENYSYPNPYRYAIEKLSEEAAKESLEAWEELLEVLEEEDREMEKARMADLNQ